MYLRAFILLYKYQPYQSPIVLIFQNWNFIYLKQQFFSSPWLPPFSSVSPWIFLLYLSNKWTLTILGLCVWLILFSKMLSRFFQFVSSIRLLILFNGEYYFLMYIYIVSSLHLLILHLQSQPIMSKNIYRLVSEIH